MSQLLIVTSQSDLHVDAVIRELAGSAVESVRLNTEDFTRQAHYYFAWDELGNCFNQAMMFQDSLRSVKNLRVIWWRKPQEYGSHPQIKDEWALKYSQDETKALLLSLSGLYPDATWINNYYNLRLPSQRINQIPVAKKLGLSIPPTLVTNQYNAALKFLQQYPDCIIKPMTYSGFRHNDEQYACYTRIIDIETLDAFRESIHLAPVFLQKRISKKAEYRVTLIGDKSFVCRIEAAHLKDPDVALDWRATEPDKLTHIPDSLPDSYIKQLRQMLQVFGLHFGAFDVIRDHDDTLYLIELNPNGQWYWIEILTGMPMVKAMVRLIEELAKQSSHHLYPYQVSSNITGLLSTAN